MSFRKFARLPIVLAACAAVPVAFAQSVVNSAKPVGSATSIGDPAPSAPMHATVWLKMRQQQAFEAAVAQMYDPQSPQYHHWLTLEDLQQYAPTAADVAAVKTELQAHGLSVLADDPQRWSVRVQGTAASIESAFHTHIGLFRKNGTTVYANTAPATLDEPAGQRVLAVSGLDNLAVAASSQSRAQAGLQPLASLQQTPVPLSVQSVPASVSTPGQNASELATLLTNRCFQAPRTLVLGTAGPNPSATYSGNDFEAGTRMCGLTVAQVASAYGVDEAHARGLRGDGQTIVLIESTNSSTILNDVNTFSTLNDLPQLTAASFQSVYPDGMPASQSSSLGTRQMSLDVEWAHAMAPNANIVLMILPTNGDDEVQFGLYYAAMNQLGNVISVNQAQPEIEYGPAGVQAYDQVIALLAAMGVAVNVPAGDNSDLIAQGPVNNVSVPADSPHATAIGGTTLGIPDGRGRSAEVGWGTRATTAFTTPEQGIAPGLPFVVYSLGGTQGGESALFAKPEYQRSLPGSGRLVPDIAAMADILPGGMVVFSSPPGNQLIGVSGGTTMASAIFSGIWALANQEAGHPLGQAAPVIARMPARAIHDIVPVGSPTDVTATLVDSTGATTSLAPSYFFTWSGGQAAPDFFSAFTVNPVFTSDDNNTELPLFPPGYAVVLGWGIDGSLMTQPGWDDVTGFGTPNGMDFIRAAAHERDPEAPAE